ncbi:MULTISPECIES: class I SAM-dependent methyltransferase [Pseudomonas]|uniref:class I SAM-dependent methyltransferase n=1 Tax=Pseudomonas TaxID=286 RepID=UPI000B35C82E|nr:MULTISPECIES: class I SAM-dependent methyltransferase [Pseudomonas]PMY43359.1 bifunctional 2-polyprenyl-6-hydroxyphenol methylase/3-demethylubiquinol 3-O-methyltransferase UbiG [Pseudomonas sp. GW456-L14]PMY53521.1 bifunctional 2-polyprenyl-6-hydroxyphenol methylase/3-demethylubiquinol 3-O-methyltransferase UbiG [Pseudomonas sp. GW456-L12]PMY66193.1 bifunctional 2-polyprenyl-6-hydroxyphenol methylase/3-demethylubiquinol 3-O-methyltransferase UbiG [Pseudomonas sp. FW305-25]PMY75101.1 bifuncti
MNCRGCGSPLRLPLIDLGTSPPSNAYLRAEQLEQAEQWVPLKVQVCQACWLVQTEDYTSAESLFDAEYAYFSSFSSTWLAHAERYVAEMVERFGLMADSRVVEVAANDGYLLQYVAARGIKCLGVEPTRSTAQAAREKGLEIRELFFGRDTAAQLKNQGWAADLMAANNVLAHVPDINDFLGGFATLLKPTGVATFEFPQLLTLMAGAQFDTLYHEHYSYLSLTAVQALCERNGLEVFDVSQLTTHGGSLRVFVQRKDGERRAVQPAVQQQLQTEFDAGVKTPEFYATLAPAAERIKHDLLRFLLQAKAEGKRVVGYGAAAKGNTLLNYAGIKPDLLAWVADASPHKQGKFLPGSRIPVVAPERIDSERPDYVLVLPWNLLSEVSEQLAHVRQWGGRFVIAVPELKLL